MDIRSKHLSSEDRGVICAENIRGRSQRLIGRLIGRPASTICRELARGRQEDGSYCPQAARQAYDARRRRCRRKRKLAEGGDLYRFVHGKLVHLHWSPELEVEGCVVLSHVIGTRLPSIQTAEELFLVFDPLVLKSSPIRDALHLVDLVLAGDGSVSSSDLHDQSGMDQRRFNPAARMIVAEIGEGRVSRPYSPDYPARYFTMAAEDRVALKWLGKQLTG
jgi:hypothetical protein